MVTGTRQHRRLRCRNSLLGPTYDARLYIRMWDTEGSGRPIDLTFTNGNEVDSTGPSPEDRPSAVGLPDNHSAYYVNYRYTAKHPIW